MNSETILAVLFWLAALAVVFTFPGYPLVIRAAAWLRPRPVRKADPPVWPAVTCVVVAHNEERAIVQRVRNLLASDYPADRLDVVVVSDGSTDQTAEQVRQLREARVAVIALPQRQGKAAGLIAGVAAARGEIVVFADARQSFAPDAVRELVRNFTDPAVGAVSGNYSIDPALGGVGEGVDAYWRLEKRIRQAESDYDSSIGCTGAIYAIRRALFQPLPPDTILDDVVIPMEIAQQGLRVVFEPAARSFDPLPVAAEREFARKRRTLAGNFQMLFRYPGWLGPWRSRLWWQLLCHKYLRLAAPVFLLLLLGTNAGLLDRPVYAALFAAQGAFYLLAAAGLLVPRLRLRLLTLPAGFVFLNAATVAGFWHYLTRPSAAGWDKTEPDRQLEHV